ncbi:EAL domain-containing protein [Pseudomonas sp. UBA2684]|uniref:EAL domain-containing protein n=1 Tax=Pseudomonas sp. UBA2684 TaxID=1947311 RepID=UPI000E83BD40|nr:EAL domain-containing protein [Pseudomonas sp. UBA2684]HBX56874.1 diguanylate cyclase [Pseudomonas sp.]|tara:strand:- start:1462 stop:4359 length:2898 start_codon:yes stop_codon:yes gene_type:complete
MTHVLRHIVLVVLLAAWLPSGQAATELPLLRLSAAQLEQPATVDHVLLLEDPHAELTATEALQRLREVGRPSAGTPRIGYSASTWWAAFSLDAPAAQRLNLIIAQPFLDDLEVWLYDRERLIAPLYSGDQRPFLQRGEPFPHFMLSLPRLAQGPHTLLIRVQSGSSISLPMQLVSAEKSSLLIAHNWLQSGLLLGALLSIALFYLVRYSTLREPQLGYYCITALSVAVYNATLHGPSGLLLPQWPWFPTLLANLATPGMLIFSTLFIASALKLKLGPLRTLRNTLFLAIILVCGWSTLSSDDYRAYQVLNGLILLTGIFQLWLVLLGLRQRRPYAVGYLLCWSAALLLMLLVPLSRAGVIPLPPGFNYLHAYLPAISMLLFGVLLDKQLDRVRRALLTSQAQAIGNLEQYQALFRSASEGIFRCTRSGVLLEANPSFMALLGDSSALHHRTIEDLLGAEQWAALVAPLHAAQPASSQECQLHDLSGQAHWIYLSLHLRPAQDCIEGIVVDLSERRALEERLHLLAARDSLTGLLNRRELERLLQESLNGTAKRRFSHLLYLDLDQFKQVNDLCGHSAGDQLLRQLSSNLQHQLPRHAELARIGGDEFAVLLREVDSPAALVQAEHLRSCVEQFVFTWQGRPFRLYASIGMLALGSGVSDWETALSWADSASQQAKHQGRNRVQQFNPADGALLEHQRQLQWITRLREAIEHAHFELFFQPVLALQNPVAGLHYEVLLRYRDPLSGEWISPGQFLSAAERYGFLGAIDRWVIQRLLQWLADNPAHVQHLVQVNVNLSASSLLDGDFHQLLHSELQRHQLPANKLCIEVTEMVALGELGVSSQWINQLRARGLKVALDDFGSGFASYAYLRHLPLDILKIDGSFISGIETDPINQAMVRSMQQIARQLGLQTVAEFVESQATLDCLRSLDIDYAQGYFIDRPQPLTQLADGACGNPAQRPVLDPSNF